LNREFSLDTYDYSFPEDLLAHNPSENRSESKLLDCRDTNPVHRHFFDLTEVFPSPCLFVRNNTRVRNGRLFGQKETGGRVECLLTLKISPTRWEGLFKPARRLRVGQILRFSKDVRFEILQSRGDGIFEVEVHCPGDFEDYLMEHGEVPLPPYIHDFQGTTDRYQTVFSTNLGASASPTAGLHFDHSLVERMQEKGHRFVDITLHIGPGTFRPVDTKDIRDFQIHREFIEIGQECVDAVGNARQEGIPIVCIGTTSLRAMETVWRKNNCEKPFSGWTSLYLYPGQIIHSSDYLITNFHLPRSSLLILVASLIGVEMMHNIYNEALAKRYRLFSFGDSMLIPNLSRP